MSEIQSSLSFVRPITNFDIDTFEDLRQEFFWDPRNRQLVEDNVQFNMSDDEQYAIRLVSGVEVAGFHRGNSLPFGAAEVDRLADYLDKTLPSSVDNELTLNTFPLCLYGAGKTMDFRAGAGTCLLEERNMLLSAIGDYYGLPFGHKQGHGQDRYTRLSLVRVVHRKSARKADEISRVVHDFLQNSTFLIPKTIELGPLDIQDTNI
ncbi:MAG: hypothetical protein WBP26_00625 [Candidatus Saccharimonadales bacterium]